MRRARLAVIALLVASIFAVGVTGSAAASEGDLSCQYEFEVFGNVYTLGQCEYEEPSYEAQSTVSYSADSLDNAMTDDAERLNNSIEAYRTLAYREAEAAFARSMANGSTKTEAQVAADQAVTKYVADLLQNQHAAQTSGYAAEFVALDEPDGTTVRDSTGDYREPTVKTRNVTVFPSSAESRNITVSYVQSHHYNDNTSYRNVSWSPAVASDSPSWEVVYSSSDYSTDSLDAQAHLWHDRWNDIKSIRGEVVNEISTFSDSVNESEYENLSAEDIPSPVTQATEFGQEYNDTGSSGYASALAASLGLASDVGTEYHVELLEDGKHYNGTLYADQSYFSNNTIETGVTYDGANQTVWLNPNDGSEFSINQDYKIHSIELSDGNTTNSTTFSDYSRTSLDETAPIDTLKEWLELQEEVGATGGDGLGSGLVGGGLGLVALLGAAFLLMRDDEGGSGGSTVILGGKGGRGR